MLSTHRLPPFDATDRRVAQRDLPMASPRRYDTPSSICRQDFVPPFSRVEVWSR